jgi:DNA-binding NarL/FixJ family response regulator
VGAPADLAAGSGRPASLRKRAAELGVSHEAVRQARIAAGEPADLESRKRAIREMAARGMPWPEIARALGMSPAGVRFVCRDMPPRPLPKLLAPVSRRHRLLRCGYR